MYRRLCFYGGPGIGKSTSAAYIFQELKTHFLSGEVEKKSVELVTEYVKSWTWIDRKPEGFDQVYITAKQLHREDMILRRSGADFIVTDSPLYLGYHYSPFEFRDALGAIIEEFDKKYPPLNIILKRTREVYDTNGRFHTKEESEDIDRIIHDNVRQNYLHSDILILDPLDKKVMRDEIFDKLEI